MKPFWRLTTGGHRDSAMVHSFLGGASSFAKNVYPRAYFAERKDMTFENARYPVSAHYDELLHQLYGEYMILPPEDQRKMKQHAILVDLDNNLNLHLLLSFQSFDN